MDRDELDFVSTDATAQSRRTCLLTYYYADMEKFSDCAPFPKGVLDAFECGKNSARVLHWAVCKENHSDGVSNHMAVTLSSTRQWLGVSQVLRNRQHCYQLLK